MNKTKSIYAIPLLLNLIAVPATSIAADFSVNGYTLSMITVSQSGDSLEVSGRLEYGPSCKHLKLSVRLESSKGSHKTVNCTVKDAGTGSSLFKGIAKIKKDEALSWSVEDIKTQCAGN